MSDESLTLILRSRLVAIIRMDDLSHAYPLTRAMLDGGVQAIEYTLTNPEALRVVPELLASCPEFRQHQATIGIGSVRYPKEARAALEAGAQFIVSPITRLDIIAECKEAGVPCFPGAMTPTEIAMAWDAGAPVIKVFPAKSLGADYIRDVLAPMPYLRLMPTGGISLDNLSQYFAAGAAAVGMGSQLLDRAAIAKGDWAAVVRGVATYVNAIERCQPMRG